MSAPASSEGKDDGEEPEAGEPTVPQAGVLGNLPKTRPAVRSPRRKKPKAAAAKAEAQPARKSTGAGTSTRGSSTEAKRPESEPVTEASPGNPASDLDALARGGIAIAGEAASLGLRIAGRAAAALRDAVERR